MKMFSLDHSLNVGMGAALAFSAFLVLQAIGELSAQALSYSKGQPVHPAFEGWEKNPDGSFGYMNDNWEQEVDVLSVPRTASTWLVATQVSRRTFCLGATGLFSGCVCRRILESKSSSGPSRPTV